MWTSPDGLVWTPLHLAGEGAGHTNVDHVAMSRITPAGQTALVAGYAGDEPVVWKIDVANLPLYDASSGMVHASDSITGADLAVPAGWHIAAGEADLTPVLGWSSISAGTHPLRPGGDRCANMPVNALEDMAADGALVSIQVGGGDGSPPGRVFDDVYPESGEDLTIHDCLDRHDLDLRFGQGWDHGRPFYALFAFGPEAKTHTLKEAFAIANSVSFAWPGETMRIEPRGAATCDPPSPYDSWADGNLTEIFGGVVPFETWVIISEEPPLPVGSDVQMVWSVGTDETVALEAVHPDGTSVTSPWPRRHSGSPFDRPGSEWSTALAFPHAGCWELRLGTADGVMRVWVEVG